MLKKYLERELQRKIKIILYLWEEKIVTSTQLAEELEVTSATIKSDIKSINIDYCVRNDPLIVSSITGYSILNKSKRNKKTFLVKIYNSSPFIVATCFFLKNGLSEKIHELEKEIYSSQAKAYEIKKKVCKYFEELKIIKNGKVLPQAEIRIRLLMAFFQWELGIEIVHISNNNKICYAKFLEKVANLEKCVFSERSKEYAQILFQINFMRRKKKTLKFSVEDKKLIKESCIYKRQSPDIRNFLENNLRFSILEEEIIFLVLVFNIMNANYYDDYSETYKSYVSLIKNVFFIKYQKLLKIFEEIFETSLKDNKLFEAAIVTFLRKCILNLQTFIPEEHASSGQNVSLPKEIVKKTKLALKKWTKQTKLMLDFSDEHILQLTSKIIFLLRKRSRPQRIYLLTSFYADYLLGKEVLTNEYGAIVNIRQFNLNSKIGYSHNDIILYDKEYPILSGLPSKKMKINYIFDIKELQMIRALLFGYNLEEVVRVNCQDINGIER